MPKTQPMAARAPRLAEAGHRIAHGDGELGRTLRRVGARQRIVEEHHHAVASKAIERALVLADQRPQRAMIFGKHLHDVFGLGSLGERGEAAQIAEQRHDLPAVIAQDRFVASRDDSLGKLRRQKTAQPADPLEFGDLSVHLGFQLLVQRLHLVVQRLDTQHCADPRHQRALVDRLGEIVIATCIEPSNDVLLAGLGRHQDHRDER